MKNKAFLKLLVSFIGGAAATPFGLWLVGEAPAIHAAICAAGGL